MSFVVLLDAPLYTGAAATEQTPHPYDVSIDGHPYFVSTDPQANEKWGVRFQQTSENLLRDQTDNSDQPGEQSLSPNQLWRRSMESWHLGAGQPRYDRKTSSPYRFDSSVGVDVWTEGELSLLDGLTSSHPIGLAANATSCVAGSRYYVAASTVMSWSSTLTAVSPTWTTVTGTPAATISSCTTDGVHVWLACNASGIYQTDTTTNAATSYVTGNVTLVGYYKGRLLCADNAGKIYNPTASGALPTVLLDLSARSWTWTSFGEGSTCLYAAGYAGDQSHVYSTAIKADGTGLNVPSVAATLPAGEIVRSVYGYLGFVVLGTDKGVRFCNPDSNGNLTLGGLIPTTAAVYDFVGQGRFVYFTWSLYDNAIGGLGRLDLSNFTSDLTPAYATDLMEYDVFLNNQYVVRNVDVWQGLLTFTYEYGTTSFVAVQDVTKTTYGPSYIQTGTIGFGIGDPKAAVFVDLRHDPLPLSSNVEVSLAVDQGTFSSLGISGTHASTGAGHPFSVNQLTGETFSLRLDFNTTNHTGLSPVVHRLTLRAYPQATRISDFSVPLVLRDVVTPDFGGEYYVNVERERDYLTTLWRTQKIVNYQEGNVSTLVALSDFEWLPEKRSKDGTTFIGVYVAHLREVLA